MGAQRTESSDLVHIYWLTNAFNFGWPERLESKVALAQLSDLFGGCNRAARGQRLHPGGETGGMANGSILGVPVASRNRANYYLAGVHTDASLKRQFAFDPQSIRVALEILLHPEGSIECTLRVVFMGERSAKQGKDAVAG